MNKQCHLHMNMHDKRIEAAAPLEEGLDGAIHLEAPRGPVPGQASPHANVKKQLAIHLGLITHVMTTDAALCPQTKQMRMYLE